jgi:hypothetical protein
MTSGAWVMGAFAGLVIFAALLLLASVFMLWLDDRRDERHPPLGTAPGA